MTSVDLTDSGDIKASNLNLPFEDNSFDVVISSGVVHHTPDAKKSVMELKRIVKPKGLLYLLIYRKPSIHYIERITSGALIRKIHEISKQFTDKVLVRLFIPIIYLGRVIVYKTFKQANYQNYKNYFYDRFITPRATFHTKKEVENWLRDFEQIDYYKGNLGYHHNFVYRKP